jgi:c-di-GMP-binding flagellar brake protein YcgR
MGKVFTKEKRQQPRHLYSTLFRGRELSVAGTFRGSGRVIRGKVHDISSGGLSLVTGQAVKKSRLIRGEIQLPDTAVNVPLLLQVRWIRGSQKGSQYRIGLQFLL